MPRIAAVVALFVACSHPSTPVTDRVAAWRDDLRVLAAIRPLVSRDNDAGLHGQLPELLLDPALLAGADLAPPDHAVFRVIAADGNARELDLRPGEFGANTAPPKRLPLHLQGPSTN